MTYSPTPPSRLPVSHDPTFSQRVVSTGGYFSVAVVALSAGYFYGQPSALSPSLIQLAYYIVFLVLLFPYYFGRQSLLEHPAPESHPHDFTSGFWFPVTAYSALLLIILIFYFVSSRLRPDNNLFAFLSQIDWPSLFAILLSSAAFYVNLLLSASFLHFRHFDRAHRFSNKVLFPAIFTCMLPFLVGYMVSLPTPQVAILYVALVYTLSAYLAVTFLNLSMASFVSVQLLITIATLLTVALGHLTTLHAIVSSMLLAMAMGVAETQKRLLLLPLNSSYVPASEGRDFLQSGSNWSSIIFPQLLPLFPLIAQNLPIWPFLLPAAAQSLHWILSPDEKKSARQCRTFGYLLPFFLIMASLLDYRLPTLLQYRAMEVYVQIVLAIVGTWLIVIVFTKLAAPASPSSENQKYPFLSLDSRLSLYFFCLLLLSVLSDIIALNMASESNPAPLEHALVINLYCVLMAAVITVRGAKQGVSINKVLFGASSGIPPSNSVSLLSAVLTSGRPLTSLIPLLIVAVGMGLAEAPSTIQIFQHSIAFFFLTMFAFIINDVFDKGKDALAQRDRPIARGLLPLSVAKRAATAFAVISLSASLLDQHYRSFAVLFSAMVLSFAYSWLSRLFPTIKGLWTAVLTLSPFVYLHVYGVLEAPLLGLFSIALFIWGREIYLDVVDHKGDFLSGLLTLPNRIGAHRAEHLAWAMMASGGLLPTLLQPTILAGALSLSNILLLAIGFCFSRRMRTQSVICLTRFNMFLAVFPLLILFG